MPTITFYVDHVCERVVGRSWQPLRKFDVIPALAVGQLGAYSYETFDALKASLCDQAAKQGFPIELTWKDSRYGREIVSVKKVEAAA